MEIKKTTLRIVLVILGCMILFVKTQTQAYAVNAVMGVNPVSGTFHTGNTVQVAVNINGNGLRFNAAQATVVVSSNLKIQHLSLGDCNFAFVRTPVTTNPSFAGVILGGESTNCTLYTLTLLVFSQGRGYVSFTNGSVKEYKTAREILDQTVDGSYTLSGTAVSVSPAINRRPTYPPIRVGNGTSNYNITYSPGVSDAEVILDPKSPQKKSQTISRELRVSDVTFENVPGGVHTISTTVNGKTISTQVINVGGSNKNIAFGKEIKQNLPNILVIVVLIVLGVILGLTVIFAYRAYKRKIQYV